MAQIYKVFFKDRVLCLTNQIDHILSGEFNAILKYANQNELKQFIDNFEQKQHLAIGYIYYHDTDKLFEHFRNNFLNIEAAGGIVTNNKEEFLAIERLGVFDLPKGKSEPGEDPITTAMREIEEECGIASLQLKNVLPSTYHTYRQDNKLILKKTHWFHFNTTKEQEPQPQTSENITSALWMKISDINTFTSNTYASITEVIKAFKLT